ncbi:MAG: type II toxin-antitoxin system HicB family antitoxin [Patescibacteria group bacterium]
MTKNLSYAIKLTYDPAYKGWVADCLNLYGCMSQGKTKKEALENIEKAIKAYMSALAKETNREEIRTKRVAVSLAV